MPKSLIDFLNSLPEEDADEVWRFFDENPGAIQEMIEVLADRFPQQDFE
jgi:hypothetical protein